MFCEYLKCARVNVSTCVYVCACYNLYKAVQPLVPYHWLARASWGCPGRSMGIGTGFSVFSAIIHDEGSRFTPLFASEREHTALPCAVAAAAGAPPAPNFPFILIVGNLTTTMVAPGELKRKARPLLRAKLPYGPKLPRTSGTEQVAGREWPAGERGGVPC